MWTVHMVCLTETYQFYKLNNGAVLPSLTKSSRCKETSPVNLNILFKTKPALKVALEVLCQGWGWRGEGWTWGQECLGYGKEEFLSNPH